MSQVHSQLTAFPEGVAEALLAGFGKWAFAVTGHGRLVKVNVESGSAEDLIVKTVTCTFQTPALIPGSIFSLYGNALADSPRVAPVPLPPELDGVRVLADGEPMPLLSISPARIWFQVPFELTDPGRLVRVELEHPSPFDACAAQRWVVRRQPYFFTDPSGDAVIAHGDFHGLVAANDPARPREVIHAYMVGLGPVMPEMPTGVTTPTDRLFRLEDDFGCRLGNQTLEIPFAGLAPGFIGVYQVSVRLPDTLPSPRFYLDCGFPDDRSHRAGVWVPTAPAP